MDAAAVFLALVFFLVKGKFLKEAEGCTWGSS